MPEARGFGFTMRAFVDADHATDRERDKIGETMMTTQRIFVTTGMTNLKQREALKTNRPLSREM
jgi:hypothetical protein